MAWRVLLPFILALSGCGASPPVGQVEGTVRREGKPLADVLVVFIPDPDKENTGERSAGMTDARGRYRLQGSPQTGWYRIAIEDMAIYKAPRDEDGTMLDEPPPRFPASYSSPLQTPLRREVKVGEQVIDLELDALD